MGKIKKGILGGFSGRVGNVIGGSWKGIDYMRSEATSISDPKTAKQLEQRSKFRVAVEFAKQVVPLINIGLKQYATKRSEFNYLVSKICKDWWDEANDDINYSLVQLSAGELNVPTIIDSNVQQSDSKYILSCEVTCDCPDPSNTLILGCLYNSDRNTYALLMPSDNQIVSNYDIYVPCPTFEDGDIYYLYLFAYELSTGVCSPCAYQTGTLQVS